MSPHWCQRQNHREYINSVNYKQLNGEVLKGSDLEMQLGFSHPVLVQAPENITFEVPSQTEIIVSGASKEQVGQIAADIRKWRKPEPYKGKGIRYEGEKVRRKLGKAAKGD